MFLIEGFNDLYYLILVVIFWGSEGMCFLLLR